jgi:site-specific recombinase XerD
MRVNRDNYLLVKQFLTYQSGHKKLDPGSVHRYECDLNYFLRWLGPSPINEAAGVEEEFVHYLQSLRRNVKKSDPDEQRPLEVATVRKAVQTTRRFLLWGKLRFPQAFEDIPPVWIEDLTAPKEAKSGREHIHVSFEEILQIARCPMPPHDLARLRDQAGLVMLYLSGMRIGALGSLPLQAVDLSQRTIRQWPSLGVETKNHKTATTYLLDIPELMAVVEAWDTLVRPQLPPTAMWFTPIISQWGRAAQLTLSPQAPGENRNIAIIKRTVEYYKFAGLPYKSPHKMRHGHVRYALERIKTMAEYKAVSLNIMHDDIKTTDGIYAPLDDAVQELIRLVSHRQAGSVEPDSDLKALLQGLHKPQMIEAMHILVEELAR